MEKMKIAELERPEDMSDADWSVCMSVLRKIYELMLRLKVARFWAVSTEDFCASFMQTEVTVDSDYIQLAPDWSKDLIVQKYGVHHGAEA